MELGRKVKRILYIPLDVLHDLTAPHLKWLGNIRQLQSLAQIVVRYALQDCAEKDNDFVMVTKKHLYKGLSDIQVI